MRIRDVQWVILLGLSMSPSAMTQASQRFDVGPGERYASIQQALDQARPGDVISVAPGEYPERLVVDKAVTLSGGGRAHIRGDCQGDVVLVAADNARVEGFSISGSGRNMMVSDAGIRVQGRQAEIVGNHLSDNLFGIYLDGCREALIEGNRIRGRAEMPLGQRGAGVHLFDAHHNRLRRNDVRQVRDGVYFDHSDFNTVEGNEFADLRYGVHYMYCSDNTFTGNLFRDSIAGVAVMYTERVQFRGNLIVNNRRGYNAFGLLLKECIDSVAEGNLIVNNGRGIFLDSSHRNLFRRNLVAYNDVGVVLYASSLENRFALNDFIDNSTTLHTVGKAKANWTPSGQGNYFSGYRGYDLDGDGVGDVPHRLQDAFEYLQGNRPLLRFYLSSAAAETLAAAERSFPLVPSSGQFDQAPRMKPVSGVEEIDTLGQLSDPASPAASAAALALLAAGGWLSWRLRR
ncbi:MAG TPA: nitrous oxide reductase family maturation protein NosD [Acidobacteriota bacterium]|nr:nitrous oxide reductase family maturation protein NosD [Acidobacteriota bacterium]